MRKRQPKGSPKTTCSKCDNQLESNRIGKYRYCKSCHAEYMRLNRTKYVDYTPEQKKKSDARSRLYMAIKRGKLFKQPCCICGDTNVEAHHDDYDRPLDVKWYCRKHHLDLHT